MRYILFIILLLLSVSFAEEEILDTAVLSDEELSELISSQNILMELRLLEEGLSISLADITTSALPVNNSPDISYYSATSDSPVIGKKKPSGDDTYYTINGNCDITIHGYDKQRLYNMATSEWSLEASYTLPVYNVGYLTYGDVTLCDIEELKEGKDYSAFINNVTINGFSSNYEYRLELHNGQVTLWSKLPGESPAVPEPKTSLCLLMASLATLYKKRTN